MKTATIDRVSPSTTAQGQRSSSAQRWGGRILAGLPLLFLAWDAAMKFVAIPQVVEASAQLGFERPNLPLLGAVEGAGVLLTVFARTRVFGAVLLSAYLGGAVAIHVQQDNPLLPHTLMPVFIAGLLWSGLYLLDSRVRALSPFARSPAAGL